jgi:hypothetical protein
MFKYVSKNSFPYVLNKNLSDYCKNSTNESIRKLKEKYDSKKYMPNIKIDNDDDKFKPNLNVYVVLFLLSISSMTIYFYKRIK